MNSRSLLFFASLSILTCGHVHGQHVTDSLEIELTRSLPDSVKIRVLNKLNESYYDSNPDRFILLSKMAIELAETTFRQESIVIAYLNWASANDLHGNYEAAILYNQKALNIYQLADDSLGMSTAYNNIGITYMQQGDYTSALSNIYDAIGIDEAQMDTFNLCIDYINLADVYYRAKTLSLAETWARKGFQFSKGEKSNQPYAADILGVIFLEQKRTDSAMHYFRFAEKLGRELHHDFIVNRSYLHYGKVCMTKSLRDSAQYYFSQGIVHSEGRNLSDILIPMTLNLSICYLQKEQYPPALEHAKGALALSRKIKNKFLALESAALVAKVYQSLTKTDSVVRYLQLAASYKDSILSQSVKGSIEAKTYDLQLQREQLQKKLVLSSFERQGVVLSQQRLVIGFIVIVLICISAIFFIRYRANRLRALTNIQLTAKNKELRKLNQEVNGLINTIVHDLKSPLNSIHGIFRLLEVELQTDVRLSEFVTVGSQVIANAHGIIAELLDLREMEQNVFPLTKTSFYLNDLTRDVKNQFDGMARAKEIEFTVSAQQTLVLCDWGLIKRIVDNLISNALKFSPKGKHVMFSAQQEDDLIILVVKDEGPGFHERDQEKLYGKFQKLSARPTAGESSNGLGLAIVHVLVKQLSATIDLESEWGKGATFTVKIPIA